MKTTRGGKEQEEIIDDQKLGDGGNKRAPESKEKDRVQQELDEKSKLERG